MIRNVLAAGAIHYYKQYQHKWCLLGQVTDRARQCSTYIYIFMRGQRGMEVHPYCSVPIEALQQWGVVGTVSLDISKAPCSLLCALFFFFLNTGRQVSYGGIQEFLCGESKLILFFFSLGSTRETRWFGKVQSRWPFRYSIVIGMYFLCMAERETRKSIA